MRRWNNKEVIYLKVNYGEISVEEIGESLNRTRESIEKKAKRLGLRSKKPKGKMYQNPHNKGKEGLRGALHGNWRAVGEIWQAAGNMYIKNDDGVIELYRRYVMRMEGVDIVCKKVTHIDGDRMNCDIENLEALSAGELAIRNSKRCKDPKMRALRCRMAQTGESWVDLVLQGVVGID